MVKWHDDYAKRGLSILAVFGKDEAGFDGLEKHVNASKITYPVLYDSENKNQKALGIVGYPAALLLNREGKVCWEGTFHEHAFEAIKDQFLPMLREK